MKFSSNEDIDAPITDVFAQLSEFAVYERSAIRRGIEVERVGRHESNAIGQTWDARFTLRGKKRDIRLVLAGYEPSNAMRIEADSQGLDAILTLDLVALTPKRTRMTVGLELTPKTLAARLLLQSLKLAKSNLTRRFKWKAAEHARNIEERNNRLA